VRQKGKRGKVKKDKLPFLIDQLKKADDSSPSSALTGRRATSKQTKLVQQVWNWIVHDLSEPTEEYNDMPPCPYARQALMAGRVIFHTSDDLTAAIDIKAIGDPDKFTHVFIWTDPAQMSPDEMTDWIADQNKNHFGCWLIGMHPDHPDAELSVWQSLNMDDWGILLVQSLADLDNAHSILLGTQYYRGVDDITDLVERKVMANAWYEKVSKEIEIEIEEEEVRH